MPDDQAPLVLKQFAERPDQAVVIGGFGGVQHMQSASRIAAPVHGPEQRQLAGSGSPSSASHWPAE
jgi:hypothetical protein